MIKYCKRCCLPSTKPHLSFDEEGICNACRNYENRKSVDWDERKAELMEILDRYRSKDHSNWDCIIPVSGGKDSTYQVITMLELGMNPLCVTATTCDLTPIGRENIENIKKMGVDYIEVTTNRVVRAKLNRIGLTEVGDISWPEHVSIFTVPVRMAVNFNVPLIIWGENSQNEYGGPAAAVENNVLDRRWLEEFGGMLGLRVNDLIGQEGITKKDLIPFTYPTDEELKRVGVTGIFLGYYIPWEGLHNVLVAKAHGFKSWGKVVEGDYDDYENLDNYQAGIHEYFKYLKFGFGRCSDQASMHIRRGRISREEAMQVVKERDGAFRWTYLDKKLEDILEPIGITVDEFIKICDEFTNKKLFLTDKNGKLIKDKNGNLKAVKVVRLKWTKDAETGRMKMEETAGSEKELPCEVLIIAAGFLGSQKYVTDAFKVDVDGRTNVATAPGSFKTNVERVYTAGDMHTGQSLVVKAIRQGRECAREVDNSLMGYSNLVVQ